MVFLLIFGCFSGKIHIFFLPNFDDSSLRNLQTTQIPVSGVVVALDLVDILENLLLDLRFGRLVSYFVVIYVILEKDDLF